MFSRVVSRELWEKYLEKKQRDKERRRIATARRKAKEPKQIDDNPYPEAETK